MAGEDSWEQAAFDLGFEDKNGQTLIHVVDTYRILTLNAKEREWCEWGRNLSGFVRKVVMYIDD